MPAFKNIPKILSKQHPPKRTFLTDHINPGTIISLSHDLKRLPQRPILLNLYPFYIKRLQQRVNLYVAIETSLGLVSYPHQIQENVLKTENRNYHIGLHIFNKNAIYLLHYHSHYHKGELCLFHHTFQTDVRTMARGRHGDGPR